MESADLDKITIWLVFIDKFMHESEKSNKDHVFVSQILNSRRLQSF